ncbi:hypothetical protein RND81_09G132800 [Saponaria officinalis]|uniref:Uncharacterized protein n=1 Tax=Saponaria officinalis TaxID=3572 RepID=A0AAW1IK70_SAPOF
MFTFTPTFLRIMTFGRRNLPVRQVEKPTNSETPRGGGGWGLWLRGLVFGHAGGEDAEVGRDAEEGRGKMEGVGKVEIEGKMESLGKVEIGGKMEGVGKVEIGGKMKGVGKVEIGGKMEGVGKVEIEGKEEGGEGKVEGGGQDGKGLWRGWGGLWRGCGWLWLRKSGPRSGEGGGGGYEDGDGGGGCIEDDDGNSGGAGGGGGGPKGLLVPTFDTVTFDTVHMKVRKATWKELLAAKFISNFSLFLGLKTICLFILFLTWSVLIFLYGVNSIKEIE